jgi:hypothetical protein
MGKAIKTCSVVFVETETPSRFIIPERNAERGGFGEMLVWKQRCVRYLQGLTLGFTDGISF